MIINKQRGWATDLDEDGKHPTDHGQELEDIRPDDRSHSSLENTILKSKHGDELITI